MPPNSKLSDAFDARAYLDFTAPLAGLEINQDSHPEVVKLLNTTYAMAKMVYSVPLDENTIELAAVFTPCAKP